MYLCIQIDLSLCFLSLTSDSNRCRWSCATSAPTGITLIGSWSSVSSPWNRSWMSWVAASSRRLSCCLRSYVTATQRSGKQQLQLPVMLRRSTDSTLQDVVSWLNRSAPALRNNTLFVVFFFVCVCAGDMATRSCRRLALVFSSAVSMSPVQPELLQTLNMLNHLEDWHTHLRSHRLAQC